MRAGRARDAGESRYPVGALPDGPVPAGGWDPEWVPMLGQFLVDPEGAEPLEEPDGVVLDGVELADDEPVEELLDVPDVLDVLDGVVVDGVDALVAASASNTPPVARPPVNALTASTLRRRSFISLSFLLHGYRPAQFAPGRLTVYPCRPDLRRHPHCAGVTCGLVHRHVRAR